MHSSKKHHFQGTHVPLQAVIGYQFHDVRLLERALTRYALSKEQNLGADAHMDVLATLGDAVIELIVLDTLVHAGVTEKGEISKIKMNCVNMSVLRALAERISLQQSVYWGKGETNMQIWTSGRVLAECMEAVIGAAYLDGGIIAAKAVLQKCGFFKTIPKKPKTDPSMDVQGR
ncbi:MAG: ribonuclease III [Methanomicrobiales archaeon]|jgi:ribonuclease-3|nr:ribonuclease III [Methanomicrobiales archaeon]